MVMESVSVPLILIVIGASMGLVVDLLGMLDIFKARKERSKEETSSFSRANPSSH